MWRPDDTMSETPCTLNEGQCTLIYSGHYHVRAELHEGRYSARSSGLKR